LQIIKHIIDRAAILGWKYYLTIS